MNFKEFYNSFPREIREKIIRKKVIRDGKLKIKYTTDNKNFKVIKNSITGSPKIVRIKPEEISARRKGALVAAKKSSTKRGASTNQRLRSISKRRRI